MAISDLVLGTMYFGTRTDEPAAHALLDQFVEAGGRTIDTANCYSFWSSDTGHGGQSEPVIGSWLQARGARDDVEIATKVGAEPVSPFTPEHGITGTEGLSAEVVRRELGRSLERLGTDHLDLYWAHIPDPTTPADEVGRTFGAVAAEGLTRRVGLSNFPAWQVEQARQAAAADGLPAVDAIQLTTSYVSPRPDTPVEGKDNPYGWVTADTLSYLDARPGTELWVYSPLVLGAYTRRQERPFPRAYDHPATTARLAVLDVVAAETGLDAGQVVLAWMLARGWRPIIGASRGEQLASALDAARAELTADQLGRLDEAG